MTTEAMKTMGAHENEHHDSGDMTVFGFWVYIMTDCILFASVFATYVVLSGSFAGGPTAHDIFDLPYVLIETFVLLISSFLIGLAMLSAHKNDHSKTRLYLLLTIILGIVFVSLEIYEFMHLVSIGATPSRSAFLSAFFSLVGMHGLHVTSGAIWGIVLLCLLAAKGLNEKFKTRLMCLSIFWHFLHIVWICLFTVVYLLGVIQ